MRPQEPIPMCSCGHPMSGHLKSTGACFISGCACGWEIVDGEKREPSVHKATPEPVQKAPRPQKTPSHEYYFPNKPCFYCGGEAQSVDHLVPKCRGGRRTKKNLVPACHRCNGMKGSLSVQEFLAHCERVVQTARSKVIQDGGRLWGIKASA